MPSPSRSKIRNTLLKKMAASDFALLQPYLERVALPQGAVLCPANEQVEYVYFPEGGVTSIVIVGPGRRRTEVGLFGREGMSGSSLVLGTDRTPMETFVQIGGVTAHRIGRDAFVSATTSSATLRSLFGSFVQCLAIQVSYTASSNANQSAESRLARWLLMCHDRVDGPDLELKHEFLAMMLAVRRATITDTLKLLEADGAISTTRGTISVLDRRRLEATAGEGYGGAEAEYQRLMG
jgi:CRP-like cAMP-binding protein